MARPENESTQRRSPTRVNIAGDFSSSEIAPDPQSERAFANETENLEAMETIDPQDQVRLSPADARHMRQQREQTRREELKANANSQSGLGTEAGKRLVNPTWPVDE